MSFLLHDTNDIKAILFYLLESKDVIYDYKPNNRYFSFSCNQHQLFFNTYDRSIQLENVKLYFPDVRAKKITDGTQYSRNIVLTFIPFTWHLDIKNCSHGVNDAFTATFPEINDFLKIHYQKLVNAESITQVEKQEFLKYLIEMEIQAKNYKKNVTLSALDPLPPVHPEVSPPVHPEFSPPVHPEVSPPVHPEVSPSAHPEVSLPQKDENKVISEPKNNIILTAEEEYQLIKEKAKDQLIQDKVNFYENVPKNKHNTDLNLLIKKTSDKQYPYNIISTEEFYGLIFDIFNKFYDVEKEDFIEFTTKWGSLYKLLQDEKDEFHKFIKFLEDYNVPTNGELKTHVSGSSLLENYVKDQIKKHGSDLIKDWWIYYCGPVIDF